MGGHDCATCGQHHEELPMCYGAPAPASWEAIPPDERARRGELSPDRCVIDDQFFFVIGRLEIPVTGLAEPFCWLVWVSLSEENFMRTCELWETAGRESEPPYFGWLNTSLPCHPNTLNLKTHVQTRTVGHRPSVILEPTEHPLAIEQRNGITLARVRELAECVLHGR